MIGLLKVCAKNFSEQYLPKVGPLWHIAGVQRETAVPTIA